MTRHLSAVTAGAAAFAAILMIAAMTLRMGILPDDAVMLWAGAIAAGDGEIPLGRIVSAYPSIPFLVTALLEALTPDGTPTPALLAAFLFSVFTGVCFAALRASGLGLLVSAAATALIAFHPALVRAALAGPADMFLVLFLFLLAKGLYDLRAQSAAPEVMTVALALAGLTFSHPMGAALAVASMPFLALAVRPALIANSALNVVVALVFPAIFCVDAFVYASWVFPGSGWSFFTASTTSLAGWTAGMARLLGPWITGWLALASAVAIAFALVLGAPAAIAALLWVRRRQPLITPALVLIGATVMAALLVAVTGVFGEPAPLLAAAPILAAIVMIRVPVVRERPTAAIALLVLGWFGGAAGITIADPRIAAAMTDVADRAMVDRERLDALNLGHATATQDGILVDVFNAPAMMLGRGRARGLLLPQNENFALTMLFARIDAPFVAVPDPNSATGAQDQLNKRFPKLHRSGAPGYRLIYQNPTWRMFERIETAAVSND